MIKAVIVKSNKIIKVVVVSEIEKLLLNESEYAYECSPGKQYKVGDTFDGVFSRVLRFVGIK